jgi:lysophospholipase L1-like esterase
LDVNSNSKIPVVCHLVIGSQTTGSIVSEFSLNPWETIRAELIQRRGKSIVSIARWKNTPTGLARTGVAFEFAAHRISDMAKIIGDAQRALTSDGGRCVK